MTRPLTAEAFDRMFDDGENVLEYMEAVPRPEPVMLHLDIETSSCVAADLDNAAYERGMTRTEYVRDLIMEDMRNRELAMA